MNDENNNYNEPADFSHYFDNNQNVNANQAQGELNNISNNEEELPKIVRFVIKYSGGFIKNEKQANYFLLVLVVIFILISIVLFTNTGSDIEMPFDGGSNPRYR